MVVFGVESNVAPLDQVLVHRPGPVFGRAHESPEHGFLHRVDLERAQTEHDAFVALLRSLGVTVHLIDDDSPGPDFLYQYDPSLVTRRGAVLLRSGKTTRRGEEDAQAVWYEANGIPNVGRIESPGTVDGGDVLWLDEDTVCVGRTLRTNQNGINQLKALLDGDVHVFDMAYDVGPEACLHLMSVISPVAEKLALVEMARLPSGLFEVCKSRSIDLVPIDPDEVATLACNVLAVRPGVVVAVDGNPVTKARLEASGVEVHVFSGQEICLNGSGGPTCLTRPVHRG